MQSKVSCAVCSGRIGVELFPCGGLSGRVRLSRLSWHVLLARNCAHIQLRQGRAWPSDSTVPYYWYATTTHGRLGELWTAVQEYDWLAGLMCWKPYED